MPLHALLAATIASLSVLIAPPASAAPSLRALQDPDPGVRAEAAFTLGQLGMVEAQGGAEPAIAGLTRTAAAQALFPAVSDADVRARRAAVEALGKVGGPDAESFLLSAATDADPGVRGEAALALFRQRLLKRVPEYSTAAVTRLALLSADADPEVRWRADYAFSRWPEPRAAVPLAAAQGDADWRARLFAVRALAKLEKAPDAARLSDPDVYVRAEAVAAFSAAKAWDKIPDAVFLDASPHVRAAAADAAAASGNAERFAPLAERVLASSGTLAPARALLALARLKGQSAVPELVKARQDPRWWIRASAYEASGLLPGAFQILNDGIQDRDPRVAAQALETLAGSTAPVDGVLDRVLRDPKAPLELLGTAIDAATVRASTSSLDGLLSALERVRKSDEAELREDLRKALQAVAAKHPDRADEIKKALERLPEFADKPRTYRFLKKPPEVVFTTEKGSFTIALASAADAGNHVAAFVDSVKRKLYDGLTWHRVVTAFVIQGGDPRGSGWGDDGWRLADEINPLHFERGTVGMPKAGKDTGGCQLFISLVPTPHLDGRYTAFGQVVAGQDVLDLIEPGDEIVSARLR
ncbi:MAG TPA: peptidylprolyl isomerase [Elusimicrobiota bacterium]|nr:peptidylprolyl isomerase [Elusimicrobiota bacterium]